MPACPLEALLTALPPALIRRAEVPDPGVEVAGIAVHETSRVPAAGVLTLAVGIERVAALVRTLPPSAAGVVAKCRGASLDEAVGAAAAAQLALVILDDDADWLDVMGLLRAGFAAGSTVQLVKRRLELEQLAVLLHGGASVSGQPEPDLGPGPHRVAALEFAETAPAARAAVRARVEQRLALTPPAGRFTFLAGQMSDLLYLIVTGGTGADRRSAEAVRRWLTGLLAGPGGAMPAVHVGLGRAAANPAQLPRSRREAERALAVARGRPGLPVSFDECWASASLQRTLDAALVADLETLTPLRRLREHDREHATDYVPTLAAWLRCQGNVRLAAARLHIHTNTLRYRMEKLAAVADVDLDDPEARLVLALQLSEHAS